MQVAFEGFRTAVPAARANVSMVLDSSLPDEASAGLSVEPKDLLDVAKPSQVLITQAFYNRIAGYQPALRTFPLRAGVTNSCGRTSSDWTSWRLKWSSRRP